MAHTDSCPAACPKNKGIQLLQPLVDIGQYPKVKEHSRRMSERAAVEKELAEENG